MHKIKYENFKNICRMCLLDCDINFNKNSIMLDIFHKITDIHFEINDELPQKICLKCFNFINEIHEFSMSCKHTHSALMECLNDYKNKRMKEEQEIIEETNEQMKIKKGIKLEVHNIEFIKVEPDNDLETNNPLSVDVTDSANDLLPPVSTYIQTENEDDLLNIKTNNKKVIKTTEDKQNKRKHIIEHPTVPEINKVQRRSYKCDQCEKAFTNSGHLNIHKRVHSGERPYQCDQCGKSFSNCINFKRHKRVHSGERLYKCDQCEKSFNASSDLIRHKRVHSGECPFKCDQCGKSFADSSNLRDHKRVHSDERLYKCEHCEKSFTHLNNLKVHKRVHSGERPYQCDVCEKSFSQLQNLNVHKRLHSGERPYECEHCEKSFKQAGALKYHKDVHHHDVK